MEIQLEPGLLRGLVSVMLEFSIIFGLVCWQIFDRFVYVNAESIEMKRNINSLYEFKKSPISNIQAEVLE